MLLGLPGDNTYANYREANRALWRLTLLPLAGKILGGLAEGLRAVVPEADAGGRSRPRAGAGRGPRAAVGAGHRRRFPRPTTRSARCSGCRTRRGDASMNREDMLARLIAQARGRGRRPGDAARDRRGSERARRDARARAARARRRRARRTTSTNCASCSARGATPRRARGRRRSSGSCAALLALLLIGIAVRLGVPGDAQVTCASPAMPRCSTSPTRRATRSAPGAFARTLAERARAAAAATGSTGRRSAIGWVEQRRRGCARAAGDRRHRPRRQPRGGAAARRRGERAELRLPRARLSPRPPRGAMLEDIELLEVSLVTHPLQHGARVHLRSTTPSCDFQPRPLANER